MTQEDMMAQVLKAQIPHLKTQAQLNAFMLGFDAFRSLIDSIFAGDKAREETSKDVLDKALHACRLATEIGDKYAQVPEAAQTKTAEPFVQAPAQFSEYDTQKRLLSELEAIQDMPSLTTWYQETTSTRNTITSQNFRNILIDAIRAKRIALQKEPS